MKYHFFILFLMTFVTACETRREMQITNFSPEGNNRVELIATQVDATEPWKLNFKSYHNEQYRNEQTATLLTEEIDTNNVLFEWRTNQKCIIEVAGQDDKTQILTFTFPRN